MSICIVNESLCFSMTCDSLCYVTRVIGFRHRQFGKRVLFILVFHIEKLLAWLDVVFYDLYRFSTRKSLELARITHQKIDRLRALIKKYRSMPYDFDEFYSR